MRGLGLLFLLYYAFLVFLIAGLISFCTGAILLIIGCFYDIGLCGKYGLWFMAGGTAPCLICLYVWVKGRSDE